MDRSGEHPTRVLVAEDEPHILRLLQLQLEKQDCQVLVARDGQEALDLLETEEIDIAILDVMMPYVDGLTVLRSIRSNQKTESLPVALLTVKAQDKDIADGYGSGADLYLTKPFEPSDVARILYALSGRHH